MKNGLTVSLIFEASSLNYGEGMGNITTLKHITREGGEQYTYVSRQALRYNFVEQLGWNDTEVRKRSFSLHRTQIFGMIRKLTCLVI